MTNITPLARVWGVGMGPYQALANSMTVHRWTALCPGLDDATPNDPIEDKIRRARAHWTGEVERWQVSPGFAQSFALSSSQYALRLLDDLAQGRLLHPCEDGDQLPPLGRRTLDEAWEGVMITYTEHDCPLSPGYQRSVPGWKCKGCGRQIGTSGLPPRRCDCGLEWDGVTT